MKEPMLAATLKEKDIDGLRYPLFVSPKLDGIRAVNVEGTLLSKSMKKLPNLHCQQLFGEEAPHGLDGELVAGDPTAHDVWNASTSAVMTKTGEPNVIYNVFDFFAMPPKEKKLWSYERRCSFLQEYVYKTQREHGGRLHYWQQVLVEHPDDFRRFEETWSVAGYEGIMARDPLSGYKFGRSTLKEGWLLKFKRWEDSEAKIIGFVEQLENQNEATIGDNGRRKRSSHKENKILKSTLGAFVVVDVKTKVEFEVGTGLSAALRQEIWDNQRSWKNKVIKYKFQPVGTGEKPRFPVYLGIRGKADM